jgi:hypothetical protein
MIGYVGVDEQVDKDFHRALRRASIHRFRDWVLRRSAHGHVLSFEQARGTLTRWSQVYRGMKTVEVEKIVGSVGRWRDFDESFLPVKVNMSQRWGHVDRAYHQGVELPAVSLYKIGEAYFVRDGNHRVSVARYHGAAAVDAEVVEIRGRMRTIDAQPEANTAAPATRPALAAA